MLLIKIDRKPFLETFYLNPFMTEQSVDWFLYDNGLRHESVKQMLQNIVDIKFVLLNDIC